MSGRILARPVVWTAALFLALATGLGAAEPVPAGQMSESTRRFGIFVGSNNGGRERILLRYAVSDARSVSRVFLDMGGILAADNILLIEPNVRDLTGHIETLKNQVAQARAAYKRTEIVFYYSGHADETGLLLGREQLGYRELREQINLIPADMRIVILDSCSSGAFTRAKGGVKTQPFLLDNSSTAEGYAFLTSSSATEASQESDSIGSSYFTHSLVAGLRGAADTVGDGRVTLNELYRFAYTETLARTETSIYGAQHPSYDMQVSGTGDVVLTDIKGTSASLFIDEALGGRLSIRDSGDYLIAEINKTAGRSMELGLEPGRYRITLQQGDGIQRAEITLSRDQQYRLGSREFRAIAATPAVARGNQGGQSPAQRAEELVTGADRDWPDEPERQREPEWTASMDRWGSAMAPFWEFFSRDFVSESILPRQNFSFPQEPVNIQLIPGINVLNFGSRRITDETNILLMGLTVARGRNLVGIGTASIGLINNGYMRGVVSSGIFNILTGDMAGAQMAGIFNIAGARMVGFQGAGLFNTAGAVHGFQGAGLFNVAGSGVNGAQMSGLFSIARGAVDGVQMSGLFNIAGGTVDGVQMSGLFNVAGGAVDGVQMSGLFNIAGGGNNGMQAAGLINVSGGETDGVQIGLINFAGSGGGLSLGVLNFIKGGILHPAVYIDDAEFINFSFRSGSRSFYTIFMVGSPQFNLGAREIHIGETKPHLFSSRMGLGVERSLWNFFFDLDVLAGTIVNFDIDDSARYIFDFSRLGNSNSPVSLSVQVRLSAGFKIWEHLGVFGGISYDYLRRYNENSPESGTGRRLAEFGGSDPMRSHRIGFFGGVQF